MFRLIGMTQRYNKFLYFQIFGNIFTLLETSVLSIIFTLLNNQSLIIMLEKIKNRIIEFMTKHSLNTYNIRKAVREGKGNPLGVGINTVNRIIKEDTLPSSKLLKKLLDSIGTEYLTNELGEIKEIL